MTNQFQLDGWETASDLGVAALAVFTSLVKTAEVGPESPILVQDQTTFTGFLADKLGRLIGAEVVNNVIEAELKWEKQRSLKSCFLVGNLNYRTVLTMCGRGATVILSNERGCEGASLDVPLILEKELRVSVLQRLSENSDVGEGIVEYLLHLLRA